MHLSFDLVRSVRRLVPATSRRNAGSSTAITNRTQVGFPGIAYSADAYEVTSIALSEAILNNYKAHAQNMREDILEHITNESLAFLQKQAVKANYHRAVNAVMEDSMRSVVDEVFGTLEPYMTKKNIALAGTSLTVSFTQPGAVTEALSYDRSRQPLSTVTTYRARISTSRFSIVIKGKDSAVDFYFLPVEKVMGLTRIVSEHNPIMSFTGEPNCGLIDWQVEGKPLTSERLERYCLLLFDFLIKETRTALE
jgi:hypothetical protein